MSKVVETIATLRAERDELRAVLDARGDHTAEEVGYSAVIARAERAEAEVARLDKDDIEDHTSWKVRAEKAETCARTRAILGVLAEARECTSGMACHGCGLATELEKLDTIEEACDE